MASYLIIWSVFWTADYYFNATVTDFDLFGGMFNTAFYGAILGVTEIIDKYAFVQPLSDMLY